MKPQTILLFIFIYLVFFRKKAEAVPNANGLWLVGPDINTKDIDALNQRIYTLERSAITNFQVLRVGTYAQMLPLCQAGSPRRFTVAIDTDGSENVSYEWDGSTLFFIVTAAAETQP